jgi:hypothetical protein
MLYRDLCNNVNTNCWASKLHSIIDHLGLTNIRLNYDCNANYLSLFKSRIRDQFIQDWNHTINTSPKLHYYCKFKQFFEFEDYLVSISNETTRKSLTRFRLSSHNLEIEQGRFNGIDRQNRLCKLCNQNVIESEYHFLLCCNKYDDLRRQYLGNIPWPNVHKFKQLMSTKNKFKLFKIAKFIDESMKCRNNYLEFLTAS